MSASSRVTLEIRDVDSFTTSEEVQQALHAKLQEHEGQFEVRSLDQMRPGSAWLFSLSRRSQLYAFWRQGAST